MRIADEMSQCRIWNFQVVEVIGEMLVASASRSNEDIIGLWIKSWDKRAQKSLGSAKFRLGDNKENLFSHIEKIQ